VVDVSLQPGDGGWGFLAELSGFRDAGPVRFFGLGTYLFNPRDSNRTLSTPSVLAGPANVSPEIRFNSVPDLYFAQAGAALSLGKGWTASASLRWEGVPARDLVGGEDGFRRPGYALSAAPGLSWSFDRYSLSASVPITLLRNAQEDAHGNPGDASFADWSLLVSFAVRF
jgi:hypothetical protein